MLSLMAIVGFRIPRRRGMRPAVILPSGGGQVSDDMSMPKVPASNENILELKAQGSIAEGLKEVPQQSSRSAACKDNMRSRGWLPLSSQTSHPLAVCYATPPQREAYDATVSPPAGADQPFIAARLACLALATVSFSAAAGLEGSKTMI